MEKHLAWLAVLGLVSSVFLGFSYVSFLRRCLSFSIQLSSRISAQLGKKLQNSVKLRRYQTGEEGKLPRRREA